MGFNSHINHIQCETSCNANGGALPCPYPPCKTVTEIKQENKPHKIILANNRSERTVKKMF